MMDFSIPFMLWLSVRRKIKVKYKAILDSLRFTLATIIDQCNKANMLKISDPQGTADLIFVLVDGAYFTSLWRVISRLMGSGWTIIKIKPIRSWG
jgi:hypothetical protein